MGASLRAFSADGRIARCHEGNHRLEARRWRRDGIRADPHEVEMNVLLHACCGPCLIEPLDALRRRHDITVAYANPNIHPAEEYERRRTTLADYAASCDVEVRELGYDPAAWTRAAGPAADTPSERCRRCFALRLGSVARHAVEGGFDSFATTLTVSPYQDFDALESAAAEVADAHDIAYLPTDFRDAYPESVRRSRELGMYRQNYCGCLLSRLEADRERAERKARRAAAKKVGRTLG